MVLEPQTTKGVLHNDHGQADEYGVGDAHKAIALQSISAEDKTANDGLQQIVGETHAAKEAEVT